MKIHRLSTKVLCVIILVVLSGCHVNPFMPEDDENMQDFPTIENGIGKLNHQVQYYGFAVIDCGWDDPHDGINKTNYVDEIAGFANVAQMCVYSPDENLKQRLAVFRQANVMAILHIEPILFEHVPDASTPTGVHVVLRSDADEQWLSFVEMNQKELTLSSIAAIYIVDEPVWNGVSPTDFEAALDIVKSSLPDIPTMAIEAYPVLDQIMVPGTLDWVGFDRYDSVDPANDTAWLADLETVRSARTRLDQKIVIVASTQWLPYYQKDGGITPGDMGKIVISYYQTAVSKPDVVALIGYLWPGGLDDPKQLGARGLPDEVQEILKDIGVEIIGQ